MSVEADLPKKPNLQQAREMAQEKPRLYLNDEQSVRTAEAVINQTALNPHFPRAFLLDTSESLVWEPKGALVDFKSLQEEAQRLQRRFRFVASLKPIPDASEEALLRLTEQGLLSGKVKGLVYDRLVQKAQEIESMRQEVVGEMMQFANRFDISIVDESPAADRGLSPELREKLASINWSQLSVPAGADFPDGDKALSAAGGLSVAAAVSAGRRSPQKRLPKKISLVLSTAAVVAGCCAPTASSPGYPVRPLPTKEVISEGMGGVLPGEEIASPEAPVTPTSIFQGKDKEILYAQPKVAGLAEGGPGVEAISFADLISQYAEQVEKVKENINVSIATGEINPADIKHIIFGIDSFGHKVGALVANAQGLFHFVEDGGPKFLIKGYEFLSNASAEILTVKENDPLSEIFITEKNEKGEVISCWQVRRGIDATGTIIGLKKVKLDSAGKPLVVKGKLVYDGDEELVFPVGYSLEVGTSHGLLLIKGDLKPLVLSKGSRLKEGIYFATNFANMKFEARDIKDPTKTVKVTYDPFTGEIEGNLDDILERVEIPSWVAKVSQAEVRFNEAYDNGIDQDGNPLPKGRYEYYSTAEGEEGQYICSVRQNEEGEYYFYDYTEGKIRPNLHPELFNRSTWEEIAVAGAVKCLPFHMEDVEYFRVIRTDIGFPCGLEIVFKQYPATIYWSYKKEGLSSLSFSPRCVIYLNDITGDLQKPIDFTAFEGSGPHVRGESKPREFTAEENLIIGGNAWPAGLGTPLARVKTGFVLLSGYEIDDEYNKMTMEYFAQDKHGCLMIPIKSSK
ncbi:MAG: hypothetical protein ACOX50_01660 [Patescibacteria group bacterium]